MSPSDNSLASQFQQCCSMPEHPESFPVNALVPIEGTPLEGNEVRSVSPVPVIRAVNDG